MFILHLHTQKRQTADTAALLPLVSKVFHQMWIRGWFQETACYIMSHSFILCWRVHYIQKNHHHLRWVSKNTVYPLNFLLIISLISGFILLIISNIILCATFQNFSGKNKAYGRNPEQLKVNWLHKWTTVTVREVLARFLDQQTISSMWHQSRAVTSSAKHLCDDCMLFTSREEFFIPIRASIPDQFLY